MDADFFIFLVGVIDEYLVSGDILDLRPGEMNDFLPVDRQDFLGFSSYSSLVFILLFLSYTLGSITFRMPLFVPPGTLIVSSY